MIDMHVGTLILLSLGSGMAFGSLFTVVTFLLWGLVMGVDIMSAYKKHLKTLRQ